MERGSWSCVVVVLVVQQQLVGNREGLAAQDEAAGDLVVFSA
jgi:hypothetical protein